MIRVLLVDDSFLTLSILRDLIASDPEIEIVAEAHEGRQAVEKTGKFRPDLVILDVMMPVMDGLTAVREIMADCPTPILILSANTDAGENQNAFNAIRLGALDVMRKPEGLSGSAWEGFATGFLERIHTLSRVKVMHHFRSGRRVYPAPLLPAEAKGKRMLVAIGASTGGPKVVMKLLKDLPIDRQAQVVVVQHIAAGFAPGFAEWLDRESDYRVRLAKNGDLLEGGVVLVAPNEQHMEVRGGRVFLTDAVMVNGCRPSIDVLFSSLALEPTAKSVVAVLLTGMGRDGADGLLALKGAGAYTIAQDEATSAVYGMPRAAVEIGAVYEVLPGDAIAAAVTRQLGDKRQG